LLIGNDIPIYVVDPGRVKKRNIGRQAFYEGDIGKFKAQVAAERCSRLFHRKIAYCVQPFDGELIKESMDEGGEYRDRHFVANALMIGCVDNPWARRSIDDAVSYQNWYLDAGNSFQLGQVLLGNVSAPTAMQRAFHKSTNVVEGLPMPSLQLPQLLTQGQEVVVEDCAEAVDRGEQSPVINQAMAMLVANTVYRIINGTLDYMGAYINLETGSLRYVPAEPSIVARMLNLKEEDLFAEEEQVQERIAIRV
jgi:PRTRC genetic system ThiF family protein